MKKFKKLLVLLMLSVCITTTVTTYDYSSENDVSVTSWENGDIDSNPEESQ